MEIRFEYKYEMKYQFRTRSKLNITGTGIWKVDEDTFVDEWWDKSSEDDSFEEYCQNYFYNTLFNCEMINDDSIIFNADDLKKLEEYCNNETKYW